MSSEPLVALDIGTRSVIGLVVEKSDPINIKAMAFEEHDHRAMFDGQIHDIPKVAATVFNVIRNLEEQTGQTIEKVAVAAAGRSLITVKGISKFEGELRQIDKEEVTALELQAVQTALKDLAKDRKIEGEYHCVGYSVLNYLLDGNHLRNLVGQTGKIVEVEVVATFLPRLVVDSLMAVLEHCNLKMKSLTLEPIAAAEVAIPEGMRQLNLALVDIGAGTSDIAITSGGRLSAYGMVPYAGDEITDKIAENYLLDFSVAEQVKRNLNKKEVSFKDILGNKHSKIPSEEIVQVIDNVTDFIGEKIAAVILELNSKAPHAVICIGGGSLTPKITEKIAVSLGLPASRVGRVGEDILQKFTGGRKSFSKKLASQQLITPLGISLNSMRNSGLSYCEVYVNKNMVRLLTLKNLTVADALIGAGINLREIIGKPGRALTVEINGEVTFFRGQPSKPAKITLNDKVVDLEAPISQGDEIHFSPAQDGTDCQMVVEDIIKLYAQEVYLNGNKLSIEPKLLLDGQTADRKTKLIENSKITVVPLKLSDVILKAGYELNNLVQVKLNGTESHLEAQVNNGDQIELIYEKKLEDKPTFQVIVNNKTVAISWDGKTQPILSDILPYAEIDLTHRDTSKKLAMKVNGKEAGFTTTIKTGDHISLYWE